ncbi:MAG: TauD/TfdA family dioxygenase [Alphaproteobacteria bacterium]|nr:TauD/TfdA family dioxygenase [Alphaproteobacteria bacterium]MBU0798819.1 TauD/TfdA family dioxygenase [Alphaproteobacteria bacterium]MBU0887003.1 TauD/TfdA family dioxygenase [Alphaproteobacteria bacterium]MBU1813141.1 TauD/TfdA family dioxygenase [Alphaproteobacteria bacterium]
MRESARWIVELSPADLAEIEAALAHVDRLDIPWHAITQEDFPLQGLKARLAAAREELEEGSGMVKLRTIPVERYSEAQLKRLYYGLGTHLGHLLFQNNRGELMREIRDEGAEIGQRYGEVKTEQGGTFLSSYARTLSNGALRFHTDRCDVVGLLCVRQAGRGGVSKLASSVAIHNTILERRPDLLDVLFQPYFRSRFGEEKGMEKTAYPLPIFGLQDGKFTSHYSLTYIEAAEFIPGIPPLSPAQREALTLLQQVAEELSFEMVLEPGDIQLLNNHVIYHGRTPFQDDAPSGRSRLLYRLWLAMPNSRRLPDDHAILWRDVTPGSLRGGIGQAVVPA